MSHRHTEMRPDRPEQAVIISAQKKCLQSSARFPQGLLIALVFPVFVRKLECRDVETFPRWHVTRERCWLSVVV